MHPVLILTNYTNCKNVLLELSLNATTETPSAVMFKKLEWLTIYNRIDYFRAVMMYKCMNGLAPEYLTEFFKKCSSVNNYTLRSTSLDNLHVQKPKYKFWKTNFSVLWNYIVELTPFNFKRMQESRIV